ncbi:hypothetical protein [Alteromonas macleodii]|uniref:hypothetical protein n=1 Tax=Alteromonas macleodii TaxID=28108 RepID=UPI003140413D|tara:strand:- start:43396 stop:43914 length:519 start_codon:yes stop_codon:yes gene_type:complete
MINLKQDLDPSQDYIFTTNDYRTAPIPPCAFKGEAKSIDVVSKNQIVNIWSKDTSWNPQPYKELITKIVGLIDNQQTVSDDFIYYGILEGTPVAESITTFFEGSAHGFTLLESPTFGLLNILVDGCETIHRVIFDVNVKDGDLITIFGHDRKIGIAAWDTDLNTTLCNTQHS